MIPRAANGASTVVKDGQTTKLSLFSLYYPQVDVNQPIVAMNFERFKKGLDKKPIVTARIADMAACKSKLLGVEYTVDKNDPEVKKAKEATKILHDKINKQAEFILTEVQKTTENSTGEQAITYVYTCQLKKSEITENNLSLKDFEYLFDRVSKTDDGILISEKEFNRIFGLSFMDIALGADDKKYADIMEEIRSSKRCEAIQNYKEEVTNTILNKLGYTKDELDKNFDNCFTTKNGKTVVDGKKIAEARESFIRDKISKMPANERTEETFVRECQKIDTALRAYTFNTKHDVEPTPETLPNYGTDKEKYMDLAYSMTDPRATANNLGNYFDKASESFDKQPDKKYAALSDYRVGMACLNTLKDIHAKRPWYTRFVDFFRSKGENRTINNMERKLAQMEKTLVDSKAPINQINDIKEDKNLKFTDCLDNHFEATTHNKEVLPKEILNSINKDLDTIDKKYNKDSMVKDTKEKIVNTLKSEKDLSIDNTRQKSKAVEKEFNLEK